MTHPSPAFRGLTLAVLVQIAIVATVALVIATPPVVWIVLLLLGGAFLAFARAWGWV